MYIVFITQSIVPRPLHYDKYLALSCKSRTLAQIIINVLHYDIFFKYPYPPFYNDYDLCSSFTPSQSSSICS